MNKKIVCTRKTSSAVHILRSSEMLRFESENIVTDSSPTPPLFIADKAMPPGVLQFAPHGRADGQGGATFSMSYAKPEQGGCHVLHIENQLHRVFDNFETQSSIVLYVICKN